MILRILIRVTSSNRNRQCIQGVVSDDSAGSTMKEEKHKESSKVGLLTFIDDVSASALQIARA